MKLTLEAIKIIDTIAQSGSFSKASEILHKAPSTISYSVSKIEEQMGFQFFERNGPHVTLTALGTLLLEEGRMLLTAVTDLETRLNKMASGIESSINLAFDAIFPLEKASILLRKFKESSVATEVNITREVMMGTWESLMKFRADLIVAVGEGPEGGGYSTYPIGVIPFVFCVAPYHPLAKKALPLTKCDLLDYTAVILSDSARYMPLRTVGVYEGQKRITVNTLEDKILLQKRGIGHGFLPKYAVRHELKSGELIELPVMEAHKDETLYLAWRTHDEGLALNWWKDALGKEWISESA